MKAQKELTIEIIAVGSEFLTPYYQDTNSLYLTQHLNDLGLRVNFKTVVGDRWEDLLLCFKQALSRSDLIFAMGGLGPTKDDRTREAWASIIEKELVFREDLLTAIQKRFARRKMKMPAVNKKQAYIIEGADVLTNKRGTAPGHWIDTDSSIIVLLPGPPQELKPMFEDYVLPRLIKFKKKHTLYQVIKTAGLTESRIENRLQKIYPKITDVELTTLAHPGQIEIHLTSHSEESLSHAREKLCRVQRLICESLKENIFTTEGKELEEVVGDMLKAKYQTLAVAESCTGGFLGNRITNVPGSSLYFLQGIVAYSNEAKIDLLDVNPRIIEAYGAVSSQVARAMATGIKKKSRASYGLSITGIAGPSGGTPEKPIGLVFTALSWEGGVEVKKNLFLGNRNAIKFQSSQKALDMLRHHLLDKK